MNVKDLRKLSGMTQKQFSEYFNIPMRTIQGWELGERKCPEYLLDLMQYKLEKEKEKIPQKPVAAFPSDLCPECGQALDWSCTEEEILVKAHREANLIKAKNLMKAHEEFKKKHPRPKKNKEKENK